MKSLSFPIDKTTVKFLIKFLVRWIFNLLLKTRSCFRIELLEWICQFCLWKFLQFYTLQAFVLSLNINNPLKTVTFENRQNRVSADKICKQEKFLIFFLQEKAYTINPGKQTVVDRKRFILKPVAVLQSEESKYQTDIK